MRRFRFDGVAVEVAVGEGLPELALPMAAVDPGEAGFAADIRVELDLGSLSVAVPATPVRMERGRLRAYGDENRMVWVHPELGPVIDTAPRAGEIQAALPAWAWKRTRNIFDQVLLPGLLPAFAARGLRAVHASTVDFNGKSVLVAGPSGSGKTTAALLLVSNGASLVADDLTFVYREGTGWRVCGWGDGIRARDVVWDRFSHMKPDPVDVSGKRRLPPDRVPWLPISQPRTVFILDLPGKHGWISASEALPALLSLTYHAGDERQALMSLANLLHDVPVYAAVSPEEAATTALHVMGRKV